MSVLTHCNREFFFQECMRPKFDSPTFWRKSRVHFPRWWRLSGPQFWKKAFCISEQYSIWLQPDTDATVKPFACNFCDNGLRRNDMIIKSNYRLKKMIYFAVPETRTYLGAQKRRQIFVGQVPRAEAEDPIRWLVLQTPGPNRIVHGPMCVCVA